MPPAPPPPPAPHLAEAPWLHAPGEDGAGRGWLSSAELEKQVEHSRGERVLGMARSLRSLHAAGAGLGARCTRPAPCQVPGARGGRGTSPLPAPGAGAPSLPRRVPAQPASPAAPAWLRDPPGGRAGIAPAGSGARWQPPAQLCYRLPLTVASELLGCTWADVPRDGGKGPAVRAALGAPSSAHPTPGTSPSHGTTKCLLPKPRSCRGWGWLCRWGGPSLGAAGSNKTSPRQRSVCSGSSRLHGPAHVMPADRCRAAPPLGLSLSPARQPQL